MNEDALFEVIEIDPQGSGMDWTIPIGSKVERAVGCCPHCTIIVGYVDNDQVLFTPQELRPLNDAAEELWIERKAPKA